jgi:hypothetical protein
MCEPVLIMSTMAQVAGASMQQNAANNAEQAKALAMRNNADRQRGLEDQSRVGVTNSTTEMQRPNFDEGVGEQTNVLSALYDAAVGSGAAQPALSPSSGNAPRVVQDAMTTALSAEANRAAADNMKLANLKNVGQYLRGTIDPMLTDSASQIAMNGNFMRGNSSVLGSELEAANQKAYSPMAQLLTGGGQVGMGYGLKAPKVP